MGKLENILAWQLTRVKNRSEVIAEARNKGNIIHVASLIDICHLKIRSWNHILKNTKLGRTPR